MKNILLIICLLQFLCFFATAQAPNDFYIAFSKSKTNDSLNIYISIPMHQNISYEVIAVEVKEKGAETARTFQISNRFPYGIVNGLNMYIYRIPFQSAKGTVYEVTINNQRLCNTGPFKIEEQFSSDNMHTYSYANPGYKLVNPVSLKKG
jgi:hypothetical protein